MKTKILYNSVGKYRRERNKFKRMVLEGMHIYSNKDNVVNIKSGLTIDNCWAPFVKELGFPGKGQ